MTLGAQTILCDNLEGWDVVGGGKELQEGKDLCMKVKVLVAQWCPTLCYFMGCSLPGSSINGIL